MSDTTLVTYRYEATDADGERKKGHLSAPSAHQARLALLDQQLSVLTLAEKEKFLSLQVGGRRVPRVELMHFTRQLGAFIQAGIPVIDALEAMQDGQENRTLRRIIGEIADALRSGETFLDAVERHPRVFPTFYTGMIQASELTGNLDSTLQQLAGYIERDLEARRKMRSAMAYPAIIFVMALATVVVLTTFVLPRFRSFFDTLDAELPLPTRMLLATTSFLGRWGLLIGLVVVAGVVVAALSRRTYPGRRLQDAALLRLPVLGEAVQYAVIERFCRVLASMVKAGVPLPEALIVATDGTNNRVYQAALGAARDKMLQGDGLARPIRETSLFPVSAVQMLKVGEDTGSLDQQLENAAAFYETELDYKIKAVTTFFEPAILVVVGALVGFVAIALVSAMYGIFRQVGTV